LIESTFAESRRFVNKSVACGRRCAVLFPAAQKSSARIYTSVMKSWMTMCCVAVAIALPAVAAEKKAAEPRKAAKKKPAKIEKLACRLGTEDEHARIAVLLADGKVENFAYYSKWKPRTCSMDVKRDDAFSKWVDTGNTTVVTLVEDKGAFLIDHSPGRYHFIFRDIDRMRYCGMEGKVNGSLTIWKGKAQCEVTGVMDRDMELFQPVASKPAAASLPDVTRPQAIPDLRKAAEEEKKAAATAPAASTVTPAASPASPVPAAAPAALTVTPAASPASTIPSAAPAATTGGPAKPPVPPAPAKSN
jgi:hypothetical protein